MYRSGVPLGSLGDPLKTAVYRDLIGRRSPSVVILCTRLALQHLRQDKRFWKFEKKLSKTVSFDVKYNNDWHRATDWRQIKKDYKEQEIEEKSLFWNITSLDGRQSEASRKM